MQLISHPTILIIFSLFTQTHCSETYLSTTEAYGYGLITSMGLGVMSFVLTGILLLMSKKIGGPKKMEPYLQFLMALAVGCLLGDAFIHLLPHSIMEHDEHDEHSEEEHDEDEDEHAEEEHHDDEHMELEAKQFDMNLYSMFILLGIFLFYVIETIAHKYATKPIVPVEDVEQQQLNTVKNDKKYKKQETTNSERTLQIEVNVESIQLQEQRFCDWKGKETWGYLNILIDLVCNVVDGLAIGIIFRSANSRLLIDSTVIAIYVHELPQEIADAGILLKAKFFPSQVLAANTLCNTTAILGCIIGTAIADNVDEVGQRYLIAFIIGVFIYMSCSVLIPLMQKAKDKKTYMYQFIGFSGGIAIMYAVKTLEEH